MYRKIKSYLIDVEISDHEKMFNLGFPKFDGLCQNSQNPIEAIILLPTLGQLDIGSSFAGYIQKYNGADGLKILQKDRGGKLPCGTHFEIKTIQTFSGGSKQSIIFAVYATSLMFKKIETSPNVGTVVVLPGTVPAAEYCKKNWSPTIIH